MPMTGLFDRINIMICPLYIVQQVLCIVAITEIYTIVRNFLFSAGGDAVRAGVLYFT